MEEVPVYFYKQSKVGPEPKKTLPYQKWHFLDKTQIHLKYLNNSWGIRTFPKHLQKLHIPKSYH